MKTTADTSVLVAAFASWHEHHALALAGLRRVDVVVAHCLLETYSVLTRLPAPHRMTPGIVSSYLAHTFAKHPIVALPALDLRKLVDACASQGILGGAIYDALIGATCSSAHLRLLTLDSRARPTYALVGVDQELLA